MTLQAQSGRSACRSASPEVDGARESLVDGSLAYIKIDKIVGPFRAPDLVFAVEGPGDADFRLREEVGHGEIDQRASAAIAVSHLAATPAVRRTRSDVLVAEQLD